jgi:hypothetical protein
MDNQEDLGCEKQNSTNSYELFQPWRILLGWIFSDFKSLSNIKTPRIQARGLSMSVIVFFVIMDLKIIIFLIFITDF